MAENNRIENLLLGQNKVLTNIAKGYNNEAFIGSKLFPLVEVDTENIRIPEFARDHLKIFKSERTLYGDPFMIKPGDLGWTDVKLDEKSLDYPIDWREIDAVKGLLNLTKVGAKTVADSLLLEREWRISTAVQDASNYASANKITLSGTSQWSHSDSNPIDIINTGIIAVQSSCGMRPNTIAMGLSAWEKFSKHAKVIAAIFGSNGYGVVTTDMVAKLFNVKNVSVGAAFHDISENTSDTPSFTSLWNDNCIIAYVPQNTKGKASFYESGFGYTLQHQATPPLINNFWKDDRKKVHIVEGTLLTKHVMLDAKCGYLISDTNA